MTLFAYALRSLSAKISGRNDAVKADVVIYVVTMIEIDRERDAAKSARLDSRDISS